VREREKAEAAQKHEELKASTQEVIGTLGETVLATEDQLDGIPFALDRVASAN